MNIYNVNIGGETVITRVADRSAFVNHVISELRNELSSTNPIVGIDVINSGELFLFCVKKRCLIIQFKRLPDYSNDRYQIPSYIASFLQDESITFVGSRDLKNMYCEWYRGLQNFDFKTVVEVGYLVAKIREKPTLLNSKLEELMAEVELDIRGQVIANESRRHLWISSSEVLSKEEVKPGTLELLFYYDPMSS